MVLNAERRHGAMLEAFNRVVVHIDVRDVHIIQVQTLGIDGKTVILSGNLDLLALDIEDRMVSTVVPELQLVCAPAQREPENLMSQANSENRFLSQKLSDVPDRVVHSLRISGTI